MKTQNLLTTSIIAISIVVAMIIGANALMNRNKHDNTISVTGLAERNFESDLIVWQSQFSAKSMSLTDAYTQIKKNNETTLRFLISKGVPDSAITFSAVDLSNEFNYIQDNGRSQNIFDGYRLTQTVSITSGEVEKVEKISREITELINQGIEINSFAPQYFYTKLSDLKIEMLAEATKDGLLRATTIAENSDAKLGKLKQSTMGIFQIVAQNSSEEYSWGGSYNTSSKKKTASVTVKLQYGVK